MRKNEDRIWQIPLHLERMQKVKFPLLIGDETLKIPKLPLFDASGLMPALEAFRQMNVQWAKIAAQFDAQFRSLSPILKTLQKHEARCSRLEEAGWLPHPASPWHLLDDDSMNGDVLNEAVEGYYLREWPTVRACFETAISSYVLDDEAKATIREAMAAHGSGLYRCVPRTLFPEIERVSRAQIYNGAMKGITGQKALKDAIGSLCPSDIARDGISGMSLYRKLLYHLYESAWSPEEVAAIAAEPVPNRHASLHGYVSYNSVRHSMNALIIADYLFHAMSVLKVYADSDVSGLEEANAA